MELDTIHGLMAIVIKVFLSPVVISHKKGLDYRLLNHREGTEDMGLFHTTAGTGIMIDRMSGFTTEVEYTILDFV